MRGQRGIKPIFGSVIISKLTLCEIAKFENARLLMICKELFNFLMRCWILIAQTRFTILPQKTLKRLHGGKMASHKLSLKKDAIIGIPCQVNPGPFSEEHLVSFETAYGPVTGFVRESELHQKQDGQWLVKAIILNIMEDKNLIEVRVCGSFFTTNGLATIRPDMALAA